MLQCKFLLKVRSKNVYFELRSAIFAVKDFMEHIFFKRRKLLHIHIPIWQHGSCIHLAMATKPPPMLINLHPNIILVFLDYYLIK